MRSIQATGKSVDAAVFSGLNQLGLSIDEVSIEIVQRETKGILGIGAKPAVVVLTEKPQEEVVIPDFTKERERENRERRERRENRDRRDNRDNRDNRERRENRPAQPRTEAAAENRGERGENHRSERRDNTERRERPERRENAEAQAEAKPELVYTEEQAANEPSAAFVKGLIERMGIEGKVLAAREEDAVRLRIDCSEMGVLIGHRGETLDAVQYLASLVINRNRKTEGYTRVTINTEDYREKREETLIRLAKRIAQQVKTTGNPKALEPMNPYERRIIHSALQKHPYVTTQSEGEEPNRRVVISPKRRQNRQSRGA